MSRTVAAVDLGAESGRVTAVSWNGNSFGLEVVTRFANTPSVRDGLLRWDVESLWQDIRAGLGELAGRSGRVDSVGVDTWGVDYGLLGSDGQLLDGPVSYRDGRNSAPFRAALADVGAPRLFAATGVQPQPINTLFGLMADPPERLSAARTLLMMPDVFHHRLSGSLVSEYTIVSTSGAYDLVGNRWATELLDTLDVPISFLPEVVTPGTDVGGLLGDLAVGALAGARVVLPAAHDTASAVVGAPLAGSGSLFVSSGTWSLAGAEVTAPVVSEPARVRGLTNEGGYSDAILLQRNVMGLWILQECRRRWAREGLNYSYPELAASAAAEPGLTSLIDPDDQVFLPPGDMPGRIRDWCAGHGYPVPESVGSVARCVVDSLALSYRDVVQDIAAVTGRSLTDVTIVGGGSSHPLLSQLTADATGLAVRCGPVEATALGNAAVQMAAFGEFAGVAEIRAAIAEGVEITHYTPRVDDRWAEAAARRKLTREPR